MTLTQNRKDRILRPSETAEKLGCCRRTLYRWIKAGILQKPILVGIAATGWRESYLEAFLAEREQVAGQVAGEGPR